MKRLRSTLYAAAFLVMACHAQGQDTVATSMSTAEFRQVLVDLGTYLDAHKNTDLRRQFESMPEEGIRTLYSALPNPARLQASVTALKEHDSVAGNRSQQANASSVVPKVVGAFPACAANAIIDNSAGSSCTPAYPDPTNAGWQAMVNPLITFGAFSPSDYGSVSAQGCSLTVESNLQQVTVAFQGLSNSLSPGCAIIPAPVNSACLGPLIAVAATASVSAGLYSDCVEQDGLVNAAEIDAGFHNTVTIFNSLATLAGQVATIGNNVTSVGNTANTISSNVTNLQTSVNAVQASLTNLQATVVNLQNSEASNQALNLRIAIEEELLQAGTGGLGLFELPQSAGGYLENVRQVVAETIQSFLAAGQSISSAMTSLAVGDRAFANQDYKGALTNYRAAYRLTVQ